MSPSWSLLAALTITVAVPCLAPNACAQERDRAGAEALFRAGRDAMERGDYVGACKRFDESNRLDPAIGTVFNLGACEEKQGKLAEAWGHFREVAERLPASDERVVIATARAQAIEPRLAHLTLSIHGVTPDGARVVRDGTELGLGSLGVALPVDAGAHTIVLEMPGHQNRSVRISLAEGQTRRLELEPGPPIEAGSVVPAPGTGTSSSPVPHDRIAAVSNGRKTWSVVLVGAGAAGIVASLVTGAVVLSSKNTVSEHCKDKQCDPQGLDAASTGRTFSTISTACFAVGAVALGGGIVLLATSGGSSNTSDSTRSAPHSVGALLSVGGRF